MPKPVQWIKIPGRFVQSPTGMTLTGSFWNASRRRTNRGTAIRWKRNTARRRFPPTNIMTVGRRHTRIVLCAYYPAFLLMTAAVPLLSFSTNEPLGTEKVALFLSQVVHKGNSNDDYWFRRATRF